MFASQEPSDYIVLVGAGHRVYDAKDLNDFKDGLKKQGVNVSQIGNGNTPLNENDINHFYDLVGSAKHPKIVLWGHGGIEAGKHIIELKKNISNTSDILFNIADKLKDKNAEVFIVSCQAGGVIPNIEDKLPSNLRVFTLVDTENLSLYDVLGLIHVLNTKEISQNNLTANQLLLAFLMNSVVYNSVPQIYPQQDYSNLMEKFAFLPGKKFTDLEKQTIVSELAKFSDKETILKFISEIEATKNPILTKKYSQLLALSLICARTEKYQFNTDVLSSIFNLFFNTIGDPSKKDDTVIQNSMRILKTAHIAHEDLFACLVQFFKADKENESDYLFNILLNKFSPFFHKPTSISDFLLLMLSSSGLIQKGVGIHDLWKKPDASKTEHPIWDYLSNIAVFSSVTGNLGWLLHDYQKNNPINYLHPSVISLMLTGKNFLSSLVEGKLLEKGQLPESSSYYLLRQEALEVSVLLTTLLNNVLNPFNPQPTPHLLKLTLNSLVLFEHMLEIAYKGYHGSYSDQAHQALLFNLLILQQQQKTEEIIKKLDQLDWTKDPVNPNDSDVIKKIKEFAANFRSSQNKTSNSVASTAFLLQNLNKNNDDSNAEELTEKSTPSNNLLSRNIPAITNLKSSIANTLHSGLSYFGKTIVNAAELLPIDYDEKLDTDDNDKGYEFTF